MVSTSQKIICPLARISSSLENYLLLIPITVSTSSKIALTKKILFSLSRKSVCTSRMKDIEKYVSTLRKSCFFLENLWKNWKNRCPLVGVWFVLYGLSLKISFHFCQWRFPLRGKTLNKRKRFLVIKSISTSRNEGFR